MPLVAIPSVSGETMNFPSPVIEIETIWKSRELLAVACQLVEAGL